MGFLMELNMAQKKGIMISLEREFYPYPKNSEVIYPSEYSTEIEKEAYYDGYISEYPSAYKKAYSEGLNERLKKSVAWYSIIIYTREV